MAKSVGEHGGSKQLGTNFLLAAGRNDQQAGTGVEAESECVIGGGITGVQGDEHVGRFLDLRFFIFDRRRGNRTGRENEVGDAGFPGDAVAEIDEFGPDFAAGDSRT